MLAVAGVGADLLRPAAFLDRPGPGLADQDLRAFDLVDGAVARALRRDFAATRLFDMSRAGALDTVQLVVAMVTITLFIPCIANVFVIAKERGGPSFVRSTPHRL